MMLATIFSEVIQAIGDLWKLVVAVGFVLVVIFLRKPLQQVLLGLRRLRFKGGPAEVSIETQAQEPTRPATASPQEKKEEPPTPPQPEMPTPKEAGQIWAQIYSAFSHGKFEDADEAFERLQKAEEDGVSKLRNQVYYHWLMYKHARDPQAVPKLEELTKQNDVRETALFFIALCHEFSRSYAKAIDAYSRALSGELKPSDRSRHTVGLAKCHVKMGDVEAGLKALSSALRDAPDPEAKSLLYAAIADVHENTGYSTLRALALQKVLEFSPTDPKALFAAAYSQSTAKMSYLSVANYRALLRFQPTHSSALNNLGVECETLGLPMKSVACYRKAVEQGETLAMSNLAYRYMNNGFGLEAQALLDKARKADAPHENVGKAMSRLGETRGQEADAWEKITTDGVKQQEFFWGYADAYFVPSDATSSFAGEWASPSGRVFIITEDGSTLSGKWETEKEGEKFEGTVHNLAAQVKYQTKRFLGSYLGPDWGASEDGFAYISQDGSTIRLHTFDQTKVFFLTLKRKQKEPHRTTG